MSGGFIKLYRKLTSWEWYQDANTKSLFLHLLLMANHAPAKWRGIQIDRGQHLTSVKKLAAELGLSERNIRTGIKHLEKTGELTSKATNKWTLFTIENYEFYQGDGPADDKQTDKQATSKRQASDKQVTTNKKEKKEEKKKNDSSRKEKKRRIITCGTSRICESGIPQMTEEETALFRAAAHDDFIKSIKERTVQR